MWGQRPGPSERSRNQLLWNPECSSRRKRPSVTKSFSSMTWLGLPLCHSAPSTQDQRALWGHNSWLRLVGNSCFESSFGSLGWISFWLAMWPLLEAEKVLCEFAKIRATKAISRVDIVTLAQVGGLAWDLCAVISLVDILACLWVKYLSEMVWIRPLLQHVHFCFCCIW